jgi:colanic acid/amylovoran biosynthesis protein
MELSTARCLKAALGSSRIIIGSPFPQLDRDAYPGCEVVASRRRNLLLGTLLLGHAFVASAHPSRQLFDAELHAMREAALVIDLSGDMLTEDYGVHVAYSHYLPILDAFALGKPVVLCAQSVGPFRWTSPLARMIFERAALVTLRDSISLEHLERIGVRNPNTHLTADMAFLLDPASEERVDAISAAEGLDWGKRPALGVSLSGLINEHYVRRNPAGRSAAFVPLLAKALDTIAAELDVDVVFVPHVTGPARSKDDRVTARAVGREMKQPWRSIGGDYGPDELKGLISRFSIFLGARMHANIAALSSGVPTVAISYSHKTEGIMQSFEQSGRVIGIDELTGERVTSLLRETWRDREDVKRLLLDRLRQVTRSSRRNVDLILDLLRARGTS